MVGFLLPQSLVTKRTPAHSGKVIENTRYSPLMFRFHHLGHINQHQFSSVTQSCPTLCDPMNHSTPGLPELPEFTQSHVHRVGDAIQPSHPVVPFSSCPQSLPASESFPMSQLFAGGGQSTGASALASFLPKKSQG